MQSDPVEDMVQFVSAFTNDVTPVDDVPFEHEQLWSGDQPKETP